MRIAARIGQGKNVVALKHGACRLAKSDQIGGVNAMKLVDTQAELARITGALQLGENRMKLSFILEPNAIGDNLVKTETQCRSATSDGENELRIKKWLAARES
jgi:hypothetical protein